LNPALDFYQQSLTIVRAAGDKARTAGTLASIGEIQFTLGDKTKARESLEQSVALWRELNDRRRENSALARLAAVYSALGEREKATEAYTQSLSNWRMPMPPGATTKSTTPLKR
jgi:tetratricopeptide (TPR) repeat protein